MKPVLPLALIAALAALPLLSAPALAGGGIVFDLPNLTWPDATPAPEAGSGAVLGTKSATKG